MEIFIQRCKEAGVTTRDEAASVLGFTVDRPESFSLSAYARMYETWTTVLDAVMTALGPAPAKAP